MQMNLNMVHTLYMCNYKLLVLLMKISLFNILCTISYKKIKLKKKWNITIMLPYYSKNKKGEII